MTDTIQAIYYEKSQSLESTKELVQISSPVHFTNLISLRKLQIPHLPRKEISKHRTVNKNPLYESFAHMI